MHTAATGIVDRSSNHSFKETIERLQRTLQEKGVTLFALIDHSLPDELMPKIAVVECWLRRRQLSNMLN